jgi:hypothetical protein
MLISIPSRGRVGNQVTLKFIPSQWVPFVHFWCPEEEIPLHQAQPYAAKVGHWHPAPLGIAASRQAQADYAYAEGVEWLWFIDDDLKFLRRAPEANIALPFKTPPSIEEQMGKLGQRFVSFFGKHDPEGHALALIGVSRVVWLHDPRPTEIYSHVVAACWALHLPTFFKEEIRFDAFGPLFSIEDYHIRLALGQRGYSAVALTDFAWKADGNTSGGCSIYRTPEKQTEFTETLRSAYPSLVTTIKGKGAWNNVNPKANWKKAVNPRLFPKLVEAPVLAIS